jgi:predicted phosphodiesterase
MKKVLKIFFCLTIFVLYCFTQNLSYAQGPHKPYIIHDTIPVIEHGPYITAPSKTGVTITWTTDIPAHSKVVYGTGGKLDEICELQIDGFLPVDTLHTIHLEDLKPGQHYHYRVVSTGVEKLKPYWPEKTRSVKSPVYSFTTLDEQNSSVNFDFIADSQHEDVKRLNDNLELVEWDAIDFLVHGGDALGEVLDEQQIFDKFIDPVSRRLDHSIPMVYVRGNHEMRGPYARKFKEYVPNPTGRFYYAFNAGQVHFIVLDTGEDKPDSTNVYSGLNRVKEYREEEFEWLQHHVQHSSALKNSPFRIILMHGPRWGWVNGKKERWTRIANKANIDLILSGHWHRFARISPGKYNNNFPILVVDQDQVAHVKATGEELKIRVTGKDGKTVDSFFVQNSN